MKFSHALVAICAPLLATSASAAGFNYNNFSLNYIDADYSLFNDNYEFTGYQIDGRKSFGEHGFIYGKLSQLTNDEYSFEPEIKTMYLGAGLKVPFSGEVDLTAGVGYFKQNIQFGGLIDTDDTGAVISAGFIAQLGQTAELELNADNFMVDGDANTMFSAAVRYHLSDFIVPQILLQKSNDLDSFGIGAQMRF